MDGIAMTQAETKTNVFASPSDSLRIGKRNGAARFYSGRLDEIVIEQRAWSAAEIKNKYAYYKGYYTN